MCIATSGPGATNLITGVACAYDNSIPMLVITGQPPIHSFGKNAPVIAVSANASGTDKARCLAAGLMRSSPSRSTAPACCSWWASGCR